ncbi:IS30 family transposase [Polaribacter sp. IC066]|uniref:IS30 family transposase n=1 Tax=Polaribacter sp. IC066 TaxID=57032 RepID=UPI0011BDF89A|nr:IS30 family transposase [Polaribacter sp. IC066]TXD54917.1 IS30 family transposase [Polaribacter sp. IC066]
MTHITQAQRYTICCMLNQGYNKAKIAIAIGKNRSTITREIKRNSDKRSGVYTDELASKKYAKRQKEKAKHIRFTPTIKVAVEKLIRDDYSPEQVVGSLTKEQKESVSIERIYQHIWEDKRNRGDLHTHLRRQGRRYRKRGASKDSRGIIKNRISIEQRPEIVEKRARFGDLEVDLIIGKNHHQAILTINDSASGMLKMKKVASKQADVVTRAIIELLEDWKPYLFTVTADNGKEFAGHQEVVENLDVHYYFAHPYHSWERGSNENLNGLIRQYFAKGSDFSSINEQRIKEVENKLNNRPRKRYKFENPIFVMEQLLFKQNVAFVT